MANIQQLATCITCHAWNKDGTKLAFCPDNNEVHIYKKGAKGFEVDVILKEHDHVVMSIDWAPETNRLVTCSQDRNAYVWKFENGKWVPTLVILRMNRAATSAKWSPNETKFAVASGAKIVSICYFEEENDWWVSKHIKNHKSTVTSVSWAPDNIFIATASTDFKARVCSAFVKGIDQRPKNSVWGDRPTFGKVMAEYSCGGWVHDVCWSPSGNVLGFIGHDSSVNFVDVNNGQVQQLKLPYLPFRSCIFLGEDKFAAAGYDCNPMIFNNQGGWKFGKKLDAAAKSTGPAKGSAASNARNKFRSMVDKGQSTAKQTELNTKHQNAISCLQPFQSSGGNVSKFSTTAVDGKIIFW